ncbi:MAG: TIGR00730 family Rossman fold protein [Anaeromyxobacter sp.]
MRICVFCGSAEGRRPEYRAAAEAVGRTLASRGVGVVYGGGRVGLMGAVADGALSAGGEVIGVIPTALMNRELGHPGCTQLHVVETMHERKALMAQLSDAFVALPGGVGTMEELFEAWTWSGLGIHAKPVALVDLDGFYDPLLQMMDRMVAEGFLPERYRQALIVAPDAPALLAALDAYRPPPDRWSTVKP